MKKEFLEFYQPSAEEFETLWENALVVLDANVLLNLYTYSESTTDQVLNLLSEYSDRLWLSYQAATEYHKRRCGIISKEAKRYSDISKALESVCVGLRAKKQHPYIDAELATRLQEIETDIKQALTMGESRLRAMRSTSADTICERVSNLFDGRVGRPFEIDELERIYKEGEDRYAKTIPPGFSDERKPVPDRYGDLVMWMQVIEHSKATRKPVIFITDDAKEDWWEIIDGNRVGPRRELRREFQQLASQEIYIYSTDSFTDAASALGTKMSLSVEAVKEIKDASKERAETVVIKEASDLVDDLRRKSLAGDLVDELRARSLAGKAADSLLGFGKASDSLLGFGKASDSLRSPIEKLERDRLEMLKQASHFSSIEQLERDRLDQLGRAASAASHFSSIEKLERDRLDQLGRAASAASHFSSIEKLERDRLDQFGRAASESVIPPKVD